MIGGVVDVPEVAVVTTEVVVVVVVAAALPACLGPGGERMPWNHRDGFHGAVTGIAALEIWILS